MMHLFLRQWRFAINDLAYFMCKKPLRDTVDHDVSRYLHWTPKMKNESKLTRFNYCLYHYVEFRNVFYFRIRRHRFLIGLCNLFSKAADGVEIGGDIGEGLYVSHRHAVIFPEKAGKNLRIGPGVVIGKNRGKSPRIGDNVFIAANSVVVGDIHIGDNVIIGAGSIVTKDLPSDGVYAGNPVKLIRRMEDEPEWYAEIQ